MALTSVRECTGHRTIKTQCAPMSCIAVTVSSRIEGIPVYLRLRGVVLERKNSPGYTDKRLSSPTPGKWSCREKGRLRDNSSARDLMRTVTKMWLASQTQWRAPESKTGFVELCTQFSGSKYSVSCRVVLCCVVLRGSFQRSAMPRTIRTPFLRSVAGELGLLLAGHTAVLSKECQLTRIYFDDAQNS